jgi:hypothetical protein
MEIYPICEGHIHMQECTYSRTPLSLRYTQRDVLWCAIPVQDTHGCAITHIKAHDAPCNKNTAYNAGASASHKESGFIKSSRFLSFPCAFNNAASLSHIMQRRMEEWLWVVAWKECGCSLGLPTQSTHEPDTSAWPGQSFHSGNVQTYVHCPTWRTISRCRNGASLF